MSDPPSLLQAAEECLRFTLWTKIPHLLRSRAPDAIQALLGKGVTLLELEDQEDPSEEAIMDAPEDHTRAHIDVKTVLREVLAPYRLTPAAERDAFLPLTGPGVPDGCAFFFLLDNHVPPYAARSLTEAALCVVLHANDRLNEEYNALVAAMGVHVVRLKDVAALDTAALSEKAKNLLAARTVVRTAVGEEPVDPSHVAKRIADQMRVDPDHIEMYASTRDDRLFEAATARILLPMVDQLLPLGARFTGKTVPDGFIIHGYSCPQPEVVSYDCKSKEKDLYTLDADDADQQTRYLQLQRRLEDAYFWKGHGILLFTPHVDKKTFEQKIVKEPWTVFTAARGTMVIIQAELLKVWHRFTSKEDPAQFRALFNTGNFWRAVTQRTFEGLTESEQEILVGDRAKRIRLMTHEEAEMAWLAGFATPHQAMIQLAHVVSDVEPSRALGPRLSRSVVLQTFFKALREDKVTSERIAAEMGLTPKAVEYLLRCRAFHPTEPKEAGPNGFMNLDRLRRKLGLPTLF